MEDQNRLSPVEDKDRTTVIIVYILYLIGFATGISAVVGVILAHSKETGSGVWRSHFDYQMRTFWLGLGTIIVGAVLSLVLIGWLVIAWWCLWTVIRVVRGLMLAINCEPIEDPQTLLW
ncbi:DUF4870 family protein [Kordiimonas aestuarii]|uniref:DUF4870 family protein n=1 Tax=Kordiimonas aestuarii TaxID=1005925 RepID=UPI0021D1EEBC|nr:hypothetical protein [Kordiimonas aestuarii]